MVRYCFCTSSPCYYYWVLLVLIGTTIVVVCVRHKRFIQWWDQDRFCSNNCRKRKQLFKVFLHTSKFFSFPFWGRALNFYTLAQCHLYTSAKKYWETYWFIPTSSFSSASVGRGMHKQSWPSECLLVLTNSWSLNSVKWEFNVTWLLTRKRSRHIVYKSLIGIPEKKKIDSV